MAENVTSSPVMNTVLGAGSNLAVKSAAKYLIGLAIDQ